MREAEIEQTPEGAVPAGDGWFIRNLADLAWESAPRFGAWRDLLPGAHVHVLHAGEAPGYYHAEDAAEGFVVLSGECLALVEGEEQRMRQWDYLHTPPGTAHLTIGTGDEPCVIMMLGSPDPTRKVEWLADELAAKHGWSVARTTSVDTEVYTDLPPVARVPAPQPFT
jgi:oxalate decarboxylase/phosphoglucose isomerase-like protein (cupin superfamily)